MIVNNGKYRNTTFVMRRHANGIERFDGSFPVIENINDPFSDQLGLTIEEFQLLSDEDYLNRLNSFYLYLEFKYSFFKKSAYPDIVDNGEDLVKCPLDYSLSDLPYLNLDLKITENVDDSQAELDLVLNTFDGSETSISESVTATILIKEFEGQGYVDWTTVQGESVDVVIPSGQSRVNVLPLFRYMGIDLNDGLELKNIYAEITNIVEEGVVMGQNRIVFTKSMEPFFLMNLISNTNQSYQDIPAAVIMELGMSKGEGLSDPNNLLFTFSPNVKTRPVLIYPATYSDLSEINYIEENDLDILSAGAFTRFEINLNYDGALTLFKVYSANNLIIYPKRVNYRFNF